MPLDYEDYELSVWTLSSIQPTLLDENKNKFMFVF